MSYEPAGMAPNTNLPFRDDFYLLLNQAKDYLQAARNVSANNHVYIALSCIRQSAEFSLKAAIVATSQATIKSRNPYRLWHQVLPHVSISNIFPRNSAFEIKLFNFLKPSMLPERGIEKSCPSTEELDILLHRVESLILAIETAMSRYF